MNGIYGFSFPLGSTCGLLEFVTWLLEGASKLFFGACRVLVYMPPQLKTTLNRPNWNGQNYSRFFNTQYMTNTTIVSPVKMEYGWNFSISGLKMMVKSGLEKIFFKFLHALAHFDQVSDSRMSYLLGVKYIHTAF